MAVLSRSREEVFAREQLGQPIAATKVTLRRMLRTFERIPARVTRAMRDSMKLEGALRKNKLRGADKLAQRAGRNSEELRFGRGALRLLQELDAPCGEEARQGVLVLAFRCAALLNVAFGQLINAKLVPLSVLQSSRARKTRSMLGTRLLDRNIGTIFELGQAWEREKQSSCNSVAQGQGVGGGAT